MELRKCQRELATAHKIIKNLTQLDADIHVQTRQPQDNLIIVTGRYKGRRYVNLFSSPSQQFEETIDLMRHLERLHRRGTYDVPPGLNIEAFINAR